MYGKFQSKLGAVLLVALGVLASIIGLFNRPYSSAHLLLETVLIDICSLGLAVYGYVLNEHLFKARNFDVESLPKEDRRAIRKALGQGKLPKDDRLKPLAIQSAEADIRYQDATTSLFGLISFGVFSAILLLLINYMASLYWFSARDNNGDLGLVIAGLIGLQIGASIRKKKARALLAKAT